MVFESIHIFPALYSAYLFPGWFPCLEAHFHFITDILYSTLHLYIPSTLVVILSSLSFWISSDAIHARVSKGMGLLPDT